LYEVNERIETERDKGGTEERRGGKEDEITKRKKDVILEKDERKI
jgi:hypothetical protein